MQHEIIRDDTIFEFRYWRIDNRRAFRIRVGPHSWTARWGQYCG